MLPGMLCWCLGVKCPAESSQLMLRLWLQVSRCQRLRFSASRQGLGPSSQARRPTWSSWTRILWKLTRWESKMCEYQRGYSGGRNADQEWKQSHAFCFVFIAGVIKWIKSLCLSWIFVYFPINFDNIATFVSVDTIGLGPNKFMSN